MHLLNSVEVLNKAVETKWTQDKILWWSLQLFSFIIPISQSIGIKVLIILLVFSIYRVISNKLFYVVFERGWDSGLLLLVLLVGLIYSQDLNMGLKVIESSLSFIVVPIILASAGSFSKVKYDRIFSAFTAGLLVSCLICLIHSIWRYSHGGVSDVFFFYQLTSIVDLQPTYMAYYLIFSITFLLYSLYYDRTRVPLLIFIICLFVLFLVLMLTGGLTSLISLIFVFSFFILKFLQDQKTTPKITTVVIIFCMITGMFATNALSTESKQGFQNDYWERSILWESAIKATSNIMWGVGTGDFKLVLNQYYNDNNLSSFAESSLNSHNEFTQVFFSNGLLGLIALLILLSRPLYLSVSHKNILGILTFFPFLIYGVTEVFLGRYQGVIFFIFVHQVFIAHYETYGNKLALKNP